MRATSTLALGVHRRRQVQAAQTRLLFDNANVGIAATVIIALVLAYAQRSAVSPGIVWGWLLYMLIISAARWLLVRRYRRAASPDAGGNRWRNAFAIGAALAAAGWAAAAILLYVPARPMSEAFLVFVVGGVMLGGASLLAARPESFLAFLIPPGLVTALRLASVGDEDHLMMGLLAVLFTVATLATTWRSHRMIESSFALRFDNQDLIESLQKAKAEADAVNRELEIRVDDRTARLLEADQRKDEFLATLAHELRNPLAAIRFAVETLKAGTPPATARARDAIDRQVGQLVRLVDDLLDVSRITANKIHLRREPHDLARLMATAVESLQPLSTAAEQHLDVRMPSTPIWVEGDGARLVQILANVLGNAVKFTPPRGNIRFSADLDGTEAVIRIHDTGIGIAADVLPRVFEMFHQAEPILERSAGGLGIGLTLTRRLVEMHDGHIGVTSPGPGQGTEVEIRLPTIRSPAAPLSPPPPPLHAATGRHLRVLVVEDNLDAAEMLDLIITNMGHLTRVAHDGGSALTAASEFAPEVVIMDIGLPVMNGYAVVKTLREREEFANVHFAALTGWGQDEDRRRAQDAGFDSHFTKPLAPAMLEEWLASLSHRAP